MERIPHAMFCVHREVCSISTDLAVYKCRHIQRDGLHLTPEPTLAIEIAHINEQHVVFELPDPP